MIAQHSIDQLRAQLDVVDVISNYIELKKNGANYKAPCPFHDEKSPSFVVSPSKQIYHCFGCGAGGDSIKFVMEYEKLNYPEAIEKLASDYHFTLEHTDKTHAKINTKIMQDLHKWYQKLLDHHATAKKYLLDRGVYESSIEKFGIAYAPDSQETLNFLKATNANMQDAVELGVIGFDSGRYFARFIERIMFPIFNQQGHIVGFGGRTITGHQAKYVNSPQTKLFNKSKLLYAYNLAKDAIFKKRQIIITEGYLDVVMLHQAGFTNAVATLGTALTAEHLPLLRRTDAKVIMAYDGDQAGINAAMKAARMLSAADFGGGVVIFGGGLDPADMVKKDRIKELKAMFNEPKPFPNFILETIVSSFDLNDPREKERALHEGTAYLQTLSAIMKEEYRGYLAALLRVSSGLIRLNPAEKAIPMQQQTPMRDIGELSLIKTLLEHPPLIDNIIDYIDASMLTYHAFEYEQLLLGNFEHPQLIALSLDDSIKPFAYEDLQNELLHFLKHYAQKLRSQNRATSIEEKGEKIRSINKKIAQLTQGKLVSFR